MSTLVSYSVRIHFYIYLPEVALDFNLFVEISRVRETNVRPVLTPFN